MNGRIRQLTRDDAALYRAIRLEALHVNPEAFASSLEEEELHPLDWFADRLGHNFVLGAVEGDALVGISGFYAQRGIKCAHKGVLWGVYVTPDKRGRGIAQQLVRAVLEHAATLVGLVQLTVNSEQAPARRLYQTLGFTEYGVEKNALKVKERFFDEILMVRNCE